ncbi:hypothetical protein [Litoreibacter albidus]|uniref:Uncharacterized protein n=1 Tax=Litoreibacter albidus TaxID=670155 RepID=A0A1H3DC93_9RHOB|nr:hypothetical protein [Litoreibacter albidus]SDX63768.1 hypothetical protein SAMN04488001_0094 [Litoreibacter albidus]
MTRAANVLAGVGMLCTGGAMAMGMLGNSRPTELTFRDAAHQSTPVMVDGLTINGAAMGSFPTLASSSWMNPRGGKATLTRLAWPDDNAQIIDVHAEWTEIETGRAYEADISVPWGELHVEDVVGLTAYVTVVYGRNGEFMLFTDADPDPKTGQYNGREVTRVCGKRTPNRDQNYGLRVNEIPGLGRLIERRDQWMAVPDIETSCTGEAG